MGLLIDGEWHDQWYETEKSKGKFMRSAAPFRDMRQLSEPDRYHLYVSLACPWAHRTLIFRALHGLEDVLPVSVVDPLMLDQGWTFSKENPDHLHGSDQLHQLYTRTAPDHTGRVTVPVLWDKQQSRIVNNESPEIIRMLNTWGLSRGSTHDLWPVHLHAQIEQINALVYANVNNGVYKAGFATTQAAYDEAVNALFAALDQIEVRLQGQEWLIADQLTEADIRLFTTLVRFDAVYHGHFKCNRKRIVDYPELWRHTRRVYGIEGVAQTVNMRHITQHYHRSHPSINPHGIVPTGPALDWSL